MRTYSIGISLLTLITLLFVGCAVKPPKKAVDKEIKKETVDKHVAKQKQRNVSRLDYYKSMSMISKVSLSELDQLIDGKPTAAGELLVLSAQATAQDISEELVKSFSDSDEDSLPIVAHWNTGYPEYTNGMDPDYMISLVEDGLHVIPSWHLDPYWNDNVPESYYKESILRAAELKLPLVFIAPPFEAALLEDPYYSSIEGTNSPKVLDEDGKYYNELSPFASNRHWYTVGKRWARSDILRKIQKWYPNPPLVMFVADRKVKKLNWINTETSQRYINAYSANPDYLDEEYRREALAKAWVNKYKQLKKGFERSLKSVGWKSKIKLVSYNALPVEMGEDESWKDEATYTNKRLSVWNETSDATVSEYHLKVDGSESVSTAKGPQTRANNLPFIFEQTRGVTPEFARQLSLSDGHLFNSPQSYRGFTQMALWLTRPSVIRESATWSEDREDLKENFQEIIDSVEMIHNNPLLHKFWSEGRLLANESESNPNDSAIPTQYQEAHRWFMLNVDVNPKQPWSSSDEITVWAIALEVGTAPNREWLLYVQSPNGIEEDITVSIPGYKDVIVDSNIEGAFYVIEETPEDEAVVQTRVADTNETTVETDSQTTDPDPVTTEPDPEPAVQESTSEPDPVVEEEQTWVERDGKIYGAKPDARGAIGGGSGYSRIVTTGDYIVNSYSELANALQQATYGQVVFIPKDAVIVFDGESGLDIPEGVVVAGDRGYNGSPGGLLVRYDNVNNSDIFYIEDTNIVVRITGLRIQGPHDSREWIAESSKGIRTWGDGLEIDNCELSGFSVAAIDIGNSTNNVSIHHNYIHHNQMDGLGYGILINRSDAIIEYNKFDRNRHDVAGNGVIGCSYVARHNVSGTNTNAYYDMHGDDPDGDGGNGGSSMMVYNNYMPNKVDGQWYAVNVRGIPADGPALIQDNIFGGWIDADIAVLTEFTNRADTVNIKQNLYSDGQVK